MAENLPDTNVGNIEYISKADAVDRMNRYGSIWMEYTEGMSKHEVAERALKASKQAVIDVLENLPTADVVQVRRAEWIRTEFFMNGIVTRIYKCSCCDGVAGVRANNGVWYKSNFCPNCGARMREVTT